MRLVNLHLIQAGFYKDLYLHPRNSNFRSRIQPPVLVYIVELYFAKKLNISTTRNPERSKMLTASMKLFVILAVLSTVALTASDAAVLPEQMLIRQTVSIVLKRPPPQQRQQRSNTSNCSRSGSKCSNTPGTSRSPKKEPNHSRSKEAGRRRRSRRAHFL